MVDGVALVHLVQAGERVWSQWQDMRSPEEHQLGRREDLVRWGEHQRVLGWG